MIDNSQLVPEKQFPTYVGYEFRSRLEILGWPLVHVTKGYDPLTGKPRVSKGVIAIGEIAIGVFALGGLAVGGIAVGGLGLGHIGGIHLAFNCIWGHPS